MAKRSLDNEKDIQAVNDALEGGSKNRIKLDKKTYIRLMSKDFAAEFAHYVDKKALVCLGDYENDKGYAPKKCPACAEVEKLWEKYNKAKTKSDKSVVLKKINNIQSTNQTFMAAVKGVVKTEEDDDGDLKSYIEWEKEAKILSVSKAQWNKLTSDIFSDYDFMKTPDDLVNRNLIFTKESHKAKKQGDDDYTEVKIKPAKKKSKPPKIENDLPDLEELFVHISKKEMFEMLKDNSEDAEVLDKDLKEDSSEDKKEESKTKTKEQEKAEKLKAKKAKIKAKKELEEADNEGDPDFTKDDMDEDGTELDDDDMDESDLELDDDDDLDNNDDDYDDFQD